jgi:Skp family chaperone for outer membrane proteins
MQRPRFQLLSLLVLIISGHSAAFAVAEDPPLEPAAPVIGIVDFRQLLLISPLIAAGMGAAKKDFEPRRQELLKMQRQVAAHPNDEALRQRFNQQAGEFQSQAEARRNAVMQDGMRDIAQSIARYARQKHFDLIIAAAPKALGGGPNHPKSVDVTSELTHFIAHPPPSSDEAAAPGGTISSRPIASIKGLDTERIEESRLLLIREYAEMHGYALLVGTVYYARPGLAVTDISTEIPP